MLGYVVESGLLGCDMASFGEWFKTMQHSMLKTTILYKTVISSHLLVLVYVRK